MKLWELNSAILVPWSSPLRATHLTYFDFSRLKLRLSSFLFSGKCNPDQAASFFAIHEAQKEQKGRFDQVTSVVFILAVAWSRFVWTLSYSKVNRIRLSTPWKVNKSGCAPKGSWWHHNSATFFRLVRQCMGLMTSQLCQFRPRSILWGFVVLKLLLLFTTEGWSAQPYYINFAFYLSFKIETQPCAAHFFHFQSRNVAKCWIFWVISTLVLLISSPLLYHVGQN